MKIKLQIVDSLYKFYSLHRIKIDFILKLFLVGLIILFEWDRGNRFFVIFIIFFFVVVSFLYHRQYFTIIAATIFVIITFNTKTLDSLLVLRSATNPFVQHPKSALVNLFTPNSGKHVLPNQVQNMLFLLNEYDVSSYKLSTSFYNDDEVMQRIVESAWPIKLEETSTYIFVFKDDLPNFKECHIINQKGDTTLVDCH